MRWWTFANKKHLRGVRIITKRAAYNAQNRQGASRLKSETGGSRTEEKPASGSIRPAWAVRCALTRLALYFLLSQDLSLLIWPQRRVGIVVAQAILAPSQSVALLLLIRAALRLVAFPYLS